MRSHVFSLVVVLTLSTALWALPQPKIALTFEGTDSGGWYDKGDAAWMNKAPNYPERPAAVWGGPGQPAPIIAEGGGIAGGDCMDTTAVASMGGAGGVVQFGQIRNEADAWFGNSPAEAAFEGALSFTLTGWFNTKDPAVAISDATPRILHKYGMVSLLAASGGRLNLFLKKPGDSRQMTSDYNMFGQKDEWVFFAVTYDGAETTAADNVHFYMGSETAAVIPAGSRSTGANYGPLTWNPGMYLMLANYGLGSTHGTSAFRGYLDNLRVYSSTSDAAAALSGDDIEAIRRMDLGLAVPAYLPGDFNEDFQVDMDDLLLLVQQWLACNDPANPDCE